jgi:hypothetical protein
VPLRPARGGLNLNNEVFDFYDGSPQFVNQREFYKPTYSFGFRWNPSQISNERGCQLIPART